MDNKMKKSFISGCGLLSIMVGASALVGCGSGTPSAGGASATGPGAATGTASAPASGTGPVLNIDAPAGVAVLTPAGAGSGQLVAMAKEKGFGNRTDPFSLLPNERAYDFTQATERLASVDGPMTFMAPQTEPVPVPPKLEAQPYRRLSGVSIGNSVYAILETGTSGAETQLIYPGVQITGTDWIVVSISEDSAILRRSGNVLPHEIVVRLEEPPLGSQQSTPSSAGAGSAAGSGPGTPGAGSKGGPKASGNQGGSSGASN